MTKISNDVTPYIVISCMMLMLYVAYLRCFSSLLTVRMTSKQSEHSAITALLAAGLREQLSHPGLVLVTGQWEELSDMSLASYHLPEQVNAETMISAPLHKVRVTSHGSTLLVLLVRMGSYPS